MNVYVELRRIRFTYCCRKKKQRVLFCVSVALFTQHAKRMRRIILWPKAIPTVPYSSTLSHKRYQFRNAVTGQKICV